MVFNLHPTGLLGYQLGNLVSKAYMETLSQLIIYAVNSFLFWKRIQLFKNTLKLNNVLGMSPYLIPCNVILASVTIAAVTFSDAQVSQLFFLDIFLAFSSICIAFLVKLMLHQLMYFFFWRHYTQKNLCRWPPSMEPISSFLLPRFQVSLFFRCYIAIYRNKQHM